MNKESAHPELDKKCFEKIDTVHKAYWLGFLYADGFIDKFNRALILELAKKDEDLLVKFCYFVGANKEKIKFRLHKNRYESCKILISSVEFVSHIINKGCTTKKSLTIRLPEFGSEKLNLSFLMGYFDGDGDASSTVLYSGSKKFLNDIKKQYKIQSIVKKKRTVYFLNLGADLKRKMMKIYPDSLSRKRKTYLKDQGLKTLNKNFHKADKPEKRKFEISKKELKFLIDNNSLVKIGKMFKVSDNAIRKRAIRLGIALK